MKCIGKGCIYNKCNSGNYCELLSAWFTCKGYNCVIDEEIESALEAFNNAKKRYEELLLEKEKINDNQNLSRSIK